MKDIQKVLDEIRADLHMHIEHANFEISIIEQIENEGGFVEVERLRGRRFGLSLALVVLDDAEAMIKRCE